MRIGILGAGRMGGKLGTVFARAGHQVVFSYSRSEAKLKSLARKARHEARAGTPREAAESEVVLLAVPWSQVDDALHQAGDLSGKVLMTCSMPMNDDDTELVVGHTSSGAEIVARKASQARVVSAFSTVPSEVIYAVFRQRTKKAARPTVMFGGDDARAKKAVAGLISDIGFDPADVGPLRAARYLEPFTMLIAELAYGGSGSPALAYRFERFQEEELRD
jgi:8-hydroxy-5-deazaflavin:NADPH oxidoreductase